MWDFKCIADKQDWDEESMLVIALDYIREQGLEVDFLHFAQRVADEENAELFDPAYDREAGRR